MDIKEIIKLQENFDKEHSGKFDWFVKINDDNIEILEFLIIAIIGEVGELSNIVKKIVRGDFKLSESKDLVDEEITDIFIYLIKLINQMDIDIESLYQKKLEKNIERFKKNEK